jgi:hypothetical protein
MRLIIYVEIREKRNLQFQFSNDNVLLLKNNIKNVEVIDLDNFSENEYLNLIVKSFDGLEEIILICNQLDENAKLGSCAFLLKKIKYFKGKLAVYCKGCRLPAFYKQCDFEKMSKLVDTLS